MTPDVRRVAAEVRDELLSRRNPRGHWRGGLASSALSTAVASCALAVVARERGHLEPAAATRIRDGLAWLSLNVNADGGWGDTVRSHSNLPTTLLSWASLVAGVEVISSAGEVDGAISEAVAGAEAWIRERSGDLEPDSLKRTIEGLYGEDKTFSVPILTLAALAGVLGPEPDAWKGPPSLPFELAALPQSTFRFVGLPVVSYALPALIAVGQVQHHRRPSRNPALRILRQAMRGPTLRRLEAIQPSSGGFLEAIPLTGFVTLSLAGAGVTEHPVVERALDFLDRSQRPNGAWPIDIDLATWVTTLSIHGLDDLGALVEDDRAQLRRWLLGQQYRERHPFTGAGPGGWAWTDLPGGVPDADDTPGALLALHRLGPVDDELVAAARAGVRWLIDLQNRDGGLPTFCRGWGKLPFDRSSPDLTAHTLRAFSVWRPHLDPSTQRDLDRAARRALSYLRATQQPDGAWLPLWFGHQDAEDLGNRVYGTSKVVRALRDIRGVSGLPEAPAALLTTGTRYLLDAQNADGSWGGALELTGSVEETSLALDALLAPGERTPCPETRDACGRGLDWLCGAWDQGLWREATPIGFYFANLWYFEELYPLAFATAALGRAAENSSP
ncbi:MAG: prenyltransferase/squalene oxidase repeat-containing protein [Acidobacteriota bacterium]